MDEKTEELRNIFVDLTDEETVTESQEEARGSLTDDRSSSERLEDVVARMRGEYEFSTSLSDSELVRIVEGFYGGESDTSIADDLGVSRRAVFRARLDLHLIRDRDADAPFELADLRNLLAEDLSTSEIADRLDVSESTVRRYRRVIETRNEIRRVSDRFRSEFEDAVVDAELGDRLTTDVTDDGLEDATEGMETDVSF